MGTVIAVDSMRVRVYAILSDSHHLSFPWSLISSFRRLFLRKIGKSPFPFIIYYRYYDYLKFRLGRPLNSAVCDGPRRYAVRQLWKSSLRVCLWSPQKACRTPP
ncbi:uncharacterized protein Tco025E_03419 [Trypanosoma conorhini]|uniref:Uncharacterized protein n=1 Tax=Trypanosoma conorhini TaxID=83891 RepID=A0A422PVM8_9TRYP|nr:uncharacterized protein Tco025E_03419 [Trypanosoma conorhini]RNF21794.1 hypothetical protein Tco025E_03419 [Trypanosoma conorhini]